MCTVYVYVYEGAFVFTQLRIETGNSAIPGRSLVELVFNSESFKRYHARKLSFPWTLEAPQLGHYNYIEKSRGKGEGNRRVSLADIY